MNGFGSFLNNDNPLPFDLNEFYRESPPPVDQNSIQVINTQEQQQPPLNDFYNSLIPSKLEAYNPEMSFASYQPTQPPLPPAPPINNYANSSSTPYMVAPPPPPSNYNPMQMDYPAPINSGIPLPPPTMEAASDDYSWNNSWNAPPVETPHSPPHFERKGHDNNMIEYIDDSLRSIDESSDIDHRRELMGIDNGKGECFGFFLNLIELYDLLRC